MKILIASPRTLTARVLTRTQFQAAQMHAVMVCVFQSFLSVRLRLVMLPNLAPLVSVAASRCEKVLFLGLGLSGILSRAVLALMIHSWRLSTHLVQETISVHQDYGVETKQSGTDAKSTLFAKPLKKSPNLRAMVIAENALSIVGSSGVTKTGTLTTSCIAVVNGSLKCLLKSTPGYLTLLARSWTAPVTLLNG